MGNDTRNGHEIEVGELSAEPSEAISLFDAIEVATADAIDTVDTLCERGQITVDVAADREYVLNVAADYLTGLDAAGVVDDYHGLEEAGALLNCELARQTAAMGWDVGRRRY